MPKGTAAKNTMQKIMKGEVKQRSRWYFFFRNALLWAMGTISVLAGSLAVSLLIFTIANCDGSIHREVYGYTLPRITIYLTAIWLLITGGLILLSDLSVRQTKRGYIYPLWFIVLIDIVLSMIFGTIFYFAGMGAYIDNMLGDRMAHYYDIEKRREMLFNKPEQGLLMGRVSSVDEHSVQIVTANKDMWVVFTDELSKDLSDQLSQGASVVFAGTHKNDGIFVACDARITSIHGMHQEVQEKYMKLMKKMHQEQKRALMERMQNRPEGIYCDHGPVWRIQVQN